MALEFSPETLKQFDEVVSRYPLKQSAVLPVLYMAQKEFGHLSQEAIEYVAKLMDIPAARLYGVVTFYTMLNMNPVGRHHLQVCRTLPCALQGSERIINFLKNRLGINPGETTPDGKFTLSEVECLASCGTAPVMQINDDYCENLSEEKIEKVFENLK
jgi:NADH-quinone oxidoreductase subunit E